MPKQQNAMMAEIRRRELTELLNAEGHVTVNALCAHFKVSPATIRNDLNELEAEKKLKRTHGGALSNEVILELTSKEKRGLHAAEKRAIAQLAMEYVRPGQIIAIDTGTTTFEFARQIANFSNITVITNDIKIAFYLEENSALNIILLGGSVRKDFHCTVGQSALSQLDRLHADTLFLATNAVDLRWGLSTPSIENADMKRKLIENARRRILLADSSKIGAEALARFATIDEIHAMITDPAADPSFVEGMEKLGIELRCAPV